MNKDFEKILDECMDRVNRGESLEGCLADYPDHSKELKKLLGTMLKTQDTYSFLPSGNAKREARKRFYSAIDKAKRSRQKRQFVFTRPRIWITATAIVAAILISLFGFNLFYTPIEPSPNPDGNFVFLISDEVNAIGDFDNLTISISKIGLKSADAAGQWIEFTPLIAQADLTLLTGDKSLEIWRGDIPEGQYSKVFINVVEVTGVLKETGETVEIKLPSQKLQLSMSFQISENAVTNFTYDLTVVATGNQQSDIKYILKPQADQSSTQVE